jgi:hypothetical protein
MSERTDPLLCLALGHHPGRGRHRPVLAPLLQKAGNPPNMGICVACFERDIAGAWGCTAPPSSSTSARRSSALCWAQRSPRSSSASSSPRRLRPHRPLLPGDVRHDRRAGLPGLPLAGAPALAGGDLNAILGLAGLVPRHCHRRLFLKAGYNLGRAYRTYTAVGWIMPIIMLACSCCSSSLPSSARTAPSSSARAAPVRSTPLCSSPWLWAW